MLNLYSMSLRDIELSLLQPVYTVDKFMASVNFYSLS